MTKWVGYGYKNMPIPCPCEYDTSGYPYPWVKLPYPYIIPTTIISKGFFGEGNGGLASALT
jgi:hypothetical protein